MVAGVILAVALATVVDDGAPPASPTPARPSAGSSGQAPLRLLVLSPQSAPDDERYARIVAGLAAVELSAVPAFDVISSADVERLVALEAERATLGCEDTSCLAEVAGALGARLVVFGEVSRLGDARLTTLSLFDSEQARSVGRVSVQNLDERRLPDVLRPALGKLIAPILAARGEALPPAMAKAYEEPTGEAGPPLLALGLVGGGAALAAAGVVLAGVGLLPLAGGYVAVVQASAAPTPEAYDAAAALHALAFQLYLPGLVATGAGLAAALVAMVVMGSGGAVYVLDGAAE